MRRFLRVMDWIVINAVVIWLAWQGLHEQVKWAWNVFTFLVWLNFCIWLIVVIASRVEANKKLLEKVTKGHVIPPSICLSVDILLACFVAAYGEFLYATLTVITGLIQASIYSKRLKEDERNNAQ